MTQNLLVAACGLAVLGLLVAEYRESQRGKWLCKPVASLLFILVAVAAGASDTTFGRAVLAALVLSFAGDVLLIPHGAKRAFLFGLGSFLLGHVAYAVSFVVRDGELRMPVVAGAAAALAVVAIVVGRWLVPQVEPKMRVPVIAYMTVISVMVALAAGTGAPWLLVGAFAFYLSDLSVARDRFVAPGFVNRLWGLPLYYGAQLVLAVCSGA